MISVDLRKYVTVGGPVSVTPFSGQFATGVNDTGGAPWVANIFANLRKNLNEANIIIEG